MQPEADEQETAVYPFAEGHSGDANGDGVTDIEDAKAIIMWLYADIDKRKGGIAGDVPDIDGYAADYNGDGKLNSRDAHIIASYLGYSPDEVSEIINAVGDEYNVLKDAALMAFFYHVPNEPAVPAEP